MNEDRRPRPVVAVLFLGGALLAAVSVFAGWPGLGQLGALGRHRGSVRLRACGAAR